MEANFKNDLNTLMFKHAEGNNCSHAMVLIDPNDQYVALSESKREDDENPLVLYFEHPHRMHLINFNFKFPVDVILVNEEGLVTNTFSEPFRDSTASYIRGFSSLQMVILCPEHFISLHKVIKMETRVELFAHQVVTYDEAQKIGS